MARPADNCDCEVINEALVEQTRASLPTEEDFVAMERLFQVVGNPTRLRILLGLSLNELCVGDLSVLLGMTKSAVSHQLANLRAGGLVRCRRAGRVVYYSTADPHVSLMLRLGLEHARECRPSWGSAVARPAPAEAAFAGVEAAFAGAEATQAIPAAPAASSGPHVRPAAARGKA